MIRATHLVLPIAIAAALLAACDRAPRTTSTPTSAPSTAETTRTAEGGAPFVPPVFTMPTVTPSATPTPVATPTATATLTPAWSGVASLVVERDKDVWLVTSDGSKPAVRLAPGGVGYRGAGYAGRVARGEAYDLYLTAQETGDTQSGTFGVYRWRSDTRQTERVLGFSGGSKIAEFGTGNVRVQPTGRVLAYTDSDGIHLRDLWTDDDRLLLPNGRPPCTQFVTCFSNYFPDWSPDGRYLSFFRIYYEGGRTFVIEPAAEQPEAVAPEGPTYEARGRTYTETFDAYQWARRTPRVCGSNTFYSDPPDLLLVYLAVARRTVTVPVPHAEGADAWIYRCAWSSDDELVAEVRPGYTRDGGALVFYDADLRLVVSVPLAAELQQFGLVGWWPDASGVLLSGPHKEYRVVDRAGKVWPLRDLDADRILDILPE